jgi:hypothetical protein
MLTMLAAVFTSLPPSQKTVLDEKETSKVALKSYLDTKLLFF